ncbi:MAG: DUF433 domain-containing protein [Candidatus Rokubacteria bacterium]|nr:DUF433 domain-containing protein [Candidatus Rokubacteria bacterium]
MRKTLPFSLRLPPDILKEIRALAKRSQRPSSYVVFTLIEEGLRQRRCPGIVFTDGPTGRRATVAGTGIDVWEVVRVYRVCGEDPETLAHALPQLSRRQLDAALHYFRSYPKEIEERLAREETAEAELSARFPLVKPYRVS